MPITAAELVKYGAANMPEADTGTVGGAIATATRLDELVLAANDDLEIVSDNAGDTTQTITVTGRDAAGAIQTDSATLSGTTPVALTGGQVFERILKIVKSASTTGTVTIRRVGDVGDVCTMPPATTLQTIMFYDAASAASQTIRYMKEYWQNDDGALTATNVTLTITADPQARIRAGLENSADQTATNRVTAPTSVTFVADATEITVSDLAAGANVGLWIEQDLPADDPAFKSTYTSRMTATST